MNYIKDNELKNLARNMFKHCKKIDCLAENFTYCKYSRLCEELKQIPCSYKNKNEIFNDLKVMRND